MNEMMNSRGGSQTGSRVEIWAVGGGKGGTGKTFVICQLATYLASIGKRVILIDNDFGGANVHSFFGIKHTTKSISKFFDEKENLENLVVDTGIENLSIIPGNTRSVSPANIKYAHKLKLFRHIKQLNADYILIDLGGGTSTDTIDSFLLADRLIVVAIPEITSIENLYQFIKSTYFRKLKDVFGKHGLKETTREIWGKRKKLGINNIVDLLDYVKKTFPDARESLENELKDFSFHVILNKVRNLREIHEGFSVKSVCIKYIGVDAVYSGYVEYDFQFWRNLSLLQTAPTFTVSHSTRNDIMKIANNIISHEQLKIGSIKHF